MWIKEWPVSTGTGTSAVSGSTEQIRDNWAAMEEIIDVEHESMASADSGGHRPGQTGFILYGTKANIVASSTPGTGALAYTTDTGEFLIYLPTAEWKSITEECWSRVRKVGTTQGIPHNVYTKITISVVASGSYDSLGEVSSDKFIAKAAGYYLVVGIIRFPSTATNYHRAVSIYKNGAGIAGCIRYGKAERTLVVTDILYLAATDYIELYGSQDSGVSIDIVGSTLTIQRMS